MRPTGRAGECDGTDVLQCGVKMSGGDEVRWGNACFLFPLIGCRYVEAFMYARVRMMQSKTKQNKAVPSAPLQIRPKPGAWDGR